MMLSDWQARPRPGHVPLQGRTVCLHPLSDQAQYAGLYQTIAGPAHDALWTYMPLGPFADLASFTNAMQFCQSTHGWQLMVIAEAGMQANILGMAGYMRIREDHGSAEVGCVTFSPRLQQSTAATEAMYLMARHIFDDLGYRRYEWKCHNENSASKRAAERLGFVFEGIFRQDMVVKGRNRDTAWFSITDQDWAALRSGFDAWLDPDNFTAEGTQIRSLEACRT